jgi:hypothetical protein
VVVDISVESLDELQETAENASLQPVLCEIPEEAFDRV